MARDNNIKVSQQELRDAANRISAKADDYKSLFEKLLQSDLVGSLGQAWIGEDADSYIAKVESFKPNFEHMYGLMMEYVAHLRKAADDYDTVQDTLAREAQNHKYMN